MVVLNEVACKAGFQTLHCVADSGYRGSVQLTPLDTATDSNAITESFTWEFSSNQCEAINSVMHAAIGCLADKYGFKIIDPSTFFLRDMKHLERSYQSGNSFDTRRCALVSKLCTECSSWNSWASSQVWWLTYYNNATSRHFIDLQFFISGSYIYYHNIISHTDQTN